MKELGLVCRVWMKKYRSYKGEVGKGADNLLDRNFHAQKPNHKLTTDVTEFRPFGQKVYLSPIVDLYSGDIVILSESPNLLMVTTMLEQALKVLPEKHDLILHSNIGRHYQHKQYRQIWKENGITQSMSCEGNCYDNAAMESFFGHLKREFLYLQEFESVDHFKRELIRYIDYYNIRRIKARLKDLPPVLRKR